MIPPVALLVMILVFAIGAPAGEDRAFQPGGPIALSVLELTGGTATSNRSGPLTQGTGIPVGDVLEVGEGSRLVLMSATGNLVYLEPGTRLEVIHLTPDGQELQFAIHPPGLYRFDFSQGGRLAIKIGEYVLGADRARLRFTAEDGRFGFYPETGTVRIRRGDGGDVETPGLGMFYPLEG